MISASAFSRSPAVEPVRGISIEQYTEVNPDNDPGYNWGAKTSVALQVGPTQNRPLQANGLPTTLLLIGLLTLPFFLWRGIMKNLDKVEVATAEHSAETVDLMSEREKRSGGQGQQDNEQDEGKKAS